MQLTFVGAWDQLWDNVCRYVGENLYHAEDDPDVTTLAVPGYSQMQTYTCGAVAGLMVLHTFHPRRSPRRFWHLVGADPDEGSDSNQIARALRKSGVGVAMKVDMTFDAIATAIESGFPIITGVKRSGGSHWIVIYGVGRKPNRLYVAANKLAVFSKLPGPWKNKWRWADFVREKRERPAEYLVCWGK